MISWCKDVWGDLTRIVWHGHACFEINGSSTVVVDPHDGRSIGIKPPVVRADIVLISHDHFDHNCARIVKGDFITVKGAEEREIEGVKIRGVEAFHDEVRGEKRGKIIIYRFEMDGVSFCHCGDIGHKLFREQVEAIVPVDVLFIPVGGVFTIDGQTAHEVVEQIKPRIVIPMHYRLGGLSLSIHTLDPFLKGLGEDLIFRVGNEVDFLPEDLPQKTQYWVFSQ